MIRRFWITLRKFWRKVLRVEDTPHSIAMSVAVGVFIAWTPTIGLQMIITLAICWILRVNKIAGPLMAWLTNPLTIVPIFYFNYVIGRWVLPGKGLEGDAYDRISEAFAVLTKIGLWDYLTFNTQKLSPAMDAFWAIGEKILVPMIVGSLLLGAILGCLSYPFTLRSVRKYQERRDRNRKRWRAEPVAGESAAVTKPK